MPNGSIKGTKEPVIFLQSGYKVILVDKGDIGKSMHFKKIGEEEMKSNIARPTPITSKHMKCEGEFFALNK